MKCKSAESASSAFLTKGRANLIRRHKTKGYHKKQNEENLSDFPRFWCKSVTDYRTFMKDFLKVVDFVHYLKAEGYDMVTFDKVRNSTKP